MTTTTCDPVGMVFMRDKIVALNTIIRTSDSKRETAQAITTRDKDVKWLQEHCPHDLIVIMSSQGHDYEENCTIPSTMMCVVCGLYERGCDADVQDYKWYSGTYKKLLKEPFARFEPGPAYGSSVQDGRWTKGDVLETPLQDLLEWINVKGYKCYTAAERLRRDTKHKEKEEEEYYQRFKAKYFERLTKEFKETQ
jgi:hypothetical protein